MFSTTSYPQRIQTLCQSIDTIAQQLRSSTPNNTNNTNQSQYPSPTPNLQYTSYPTSTQAAFYNTTTPVHNNIHPLHSPLVWREFGAKYNLTTVDCPPQYLQQSLHTNTYKDDIDENQTTTTSSTTSSTTTISLPSDQTELSILELTYLFEYGCRISLNMRDCIGLGHARLITQLMQSEQNSYLRSVINDVTTGKGYCAICITEPTTGSDVSHIESISTQIYDENGHFIGFRASGKKEFNGRLEQCSHIIIFLKHGQSDALNAFCLPIHEYLEKYGCQQQNDTNNENNKNNNNNHNININPDSTFTLHSTPCYGLHGNSFGGFEFNNIFIPKEYMIGNVAAGHFMFRAHFSYWRLFQVAGCIGSTSQALLDVIAYIRERHVFDKNLGSFSHIQQEIAQCTTQLRMGQLLIRDIAQQLDHNRNNNSFQPISDHLLGYLAMAKSEVVNQCLQICIKIQGIYGARGYTLYMSDIGQRILDIQGLSIADGATAFMRSLVMRYIYGEDFWNMLIDKKPPGINDGEDGKCIMNNGNNNNINNINNTDNTNVNDISNNGTNQFDGNTVTTIENTQSVPSTTNQPQSISISDSTNQSNLTNSNSNTSISAQKPITHISCNDITTTFISHEHNNYILHKSLTNNTSLLKMVDYDQPICNHGGGSCPTVAIVNLLQFLYYKTQQMYTNSIHYKQSHIHSIHSNQYQVPINLLNLETLLGTIYPHIKLLPKDQFINNTNNKSTTSSNNNLNTPLDNNYQSSLSHTLLNLPLPFSIESTTTIYHSLYRFLQPPSLLSSTTSPSTTSTTSSPPSLESTQTNDNNIDSTTITPNTTSDTQSQLHPHIQQLHFPYTYLQQPTKDPSDSSVTIYKDIPVFNLFSHGRLSNEQIIWYLHHLIINYLPINTFHQYYNYYILMTTQDNVLQHTYNAYNRRDGNVGVVKKNIKYKQATNNTQNGHNINNEINNNNSDINTTPTNNNDKIITIHTINPITIPCQCHEEYRAEMTPEQYATESKHDYDMSVFIPLQSRPLIFNSNTNNQSTIDNDMNINDTNNVDNTKSNNNLPIGYDNNIQYHNTYAQFLPNMSLIDFYNACSIPLASQQTPLSSPTSTSPILIPTTTALPLLSFNWYVYKQPGADESINKDNEPTTSTGSSTSTASTSSSTSTTSTSSTSTTPTIDTELSHYSHAGRHFIVVKELKWLTSPPLTSLESKQSKLLITACDPNRPLKDYFFIAEEYQFQHPITLETSLCVKLNVKGFSSQNAGLKLVNSIYTIYTTPK